MLKVTLFVIAWALLLCGSNTGADDAVDARGELQHPSAIPTEQKIEDQHAVPKNERHARRLPTSPGTHTEYEQVCAARIEQTWRTYFQDALSHRDAPIQVTVDMAIRSDGTLSGVKLLHTSGDSTIDAATLEVVHLSAPFAPFSPSLKTEIDVLHIMRTWSISISGNLDLGVDGAYAGWLKLPALVPEQERQVVYATRPRRKILTGANVEETKYASYIAAWERKVKKVSNTHLPNSTKWSRLTGDLMLDVAINPDGTIVDVTIRRSSGQKMLDDTARRILQLAAPFSPFPPNFIEEFDVLYITRTWQFLPNGTLDIK